MGTIRVAITVVIVVVTSWCFGHDNAAGGGEDVGRWQWYHVDGGRRRRSRGSDDGRRRMATAGLMIEWCGNRHHDNAVCLFLESWGWGRAAGLDGVGIHDMNISRVPMK